MKIYRLIPLLLTTAFLNVEACSRVFWDNAVSKVVTRTMDLYTNEDPQFALSPRGILKTGGDFQNPAKWTSKWGSVVVTAFKKAVSEGVNEKGLAAHLLYLHQTDYEKRDGRPGLSNLLWVEYILDNFSTIDEALQNLTKIQIVPTEIEGKLWPLHLCMEDSTGDSAIIEFVDGKMHVHHGPQYAVVTNEPPYNIQLENLKRYRYFGGQLPLPGDVDSMSRFVRASAFLKTLSNPTDTLQALGFLLGVIRTVQVPYGAIDTSGNKGVDSWPTRWLTAIDLNHLIYYFNSTSSPNMVWVDLSALDFSPNVHSTPINLQNAQLSGDLSKNISSKNNGR